MRQLTFILTIILSITLTACGQIKTKSFGEKKAIDWTKIDFIDIRNTSNKSDTVQTIRKQLTIEQTKVFVDNWNSAKSKGPYKFIPLYFIDIYLKDGSKRAFRINNTIIKENNDLGFDLGNAKFIEKLWLESNEHPILIIKRIFDNYVQYNESTDSKNNKNLMTKSLETLTRVSEPADLELLINVWMYYDPTDFPSRDLVYKILTQNKVESIKAISTRIDNKINWETTDTAPYSELKDLLKRLKNE